MSVPASGLRRNDPTSSQKPRFSHQIHTFLLLKTPKLGCFLFFSDSWSHILIKTNPLYTIFELIKTSLSVVLSGPPYPTHILSNQHMHTKKRLIDLLPALISYQSNTHPFPVKAPMWEGLISKLGHMTITLNLSTACCLSFTPVKSNLCTNFEVRSGLELWVFSYGG